MIEHGFCEYYKVSEIFEQSSFSQDGNSDDGYGYMFCDYEDPVSVLLFYATYSYDMKFDSSDFAEEFKLILQSLYHSCKDSHSSFDDICGSSDAGNRLVQYLYDNIDKVMYVLKCNDIEITSCGAIRRIRSIQRSVE